MHQVLGRFNASKAGKEFACQELAKKHKKCL